MPDICLQSRGGIRHAHSLWGPCPESEQVLQGHSPWPVGPAQGRGRDRMGVLTAQSTAAFVSFLFFWLLTYASVLGPLSIMKHSECLATQMLLHPLLKDSVVMKWIISRRTQWKLSHVPRLRAVTIWITRVSTWWSKPLKTFSWGRKKKKTFSWDKLVPTEGLAPLGGYLGCWL